MDRVAAKSSQILPMPSALISSERGIKAVIPSKFEPQGDNRLNERRLPEAKMHRAALGHGKINCAIATRYNHLVRWLPQDAGHIACYWIELATPRARCAVRLARRVSYEGGMA